MLVQLTVHVGVILSRAGCIPLPPAAGRVVIEFQARIARLNSRNLTNH